jgi:hypothetical protein
LAELYRSKYFVWTGDIMKVDGDVRPFFPFLDQAYQRLCAEFGFELTKLPIPVELMPSNNCAGGISGYAGAGKLGYCAGSWGENHWCYGLVIQELCNLMTGDGVCGGWPFSWFASLPHIYHVYPMYSSVMTLDQQGLPGRSPFPIMISVELLKLLGGTYYKLATDRDKAFDPDPWYRCFRTFHEKGGFTLWRNLFQFMRELGVDLSKFSDPEKSTMVMSMITFFLEGGS